MTIYLLYMASPGILYLLLESFSSYSIADCKRSKRKYMYLVGIVMMLMIGLRHPENGSGDTMFYYNFWESMSKASLKMLFVSLVEVDLERGFQITTWILSHIFKNGQWALILSGAFISFSVCRFVSKNCKNVVLALTVFNCLGLFNFMVQGMRQAIAMCICLLAIEHCKQKTIKNFLKFALLIAVASFFHASAIVFSLMYVVSFAKLDVKGFAAFAAGAGISILYLPALFEIINNAINDDYALGTGSDSGGVFAILIYLVIILCGLALADKKNQNYALFFYMACIGCICMVLRRSTSEIAERVNYYFAFSQMVIMSNSIKHISEKQIGYVLNLLAFTLCIGVAIYKASYSILIPYLFFWQ